MNHRLFSSILIIIVGISLNACNRADTVEAGSAALDLQPQTVLENLDTPWGIDFLPDDSMIFTERPGRVTIFANGQRREVGRVQTNQMAESGLLGIAVDPEFQKNRSV